MRTTITPLLLLFSIALSTSLHRPNITHHHVSETTLPTLALSFNYSAPPTDDRSTRRLTSFFKLAHSRVTLQSDLRAVAKVLLPLYVQLCASVSDCDEGVMELLADHQNELRLAADRMDRLQLVLNRVRRLYHGKSHRGLWRTRRPMVAEE